MSPQRRRKPGGRAAPPARAATGADFWGTKVPHDDDDVDDIALPVDPTALVRSLGQAPLQGRETVAEHYFVTVYDKAAALATALAAAADLLAGADDAFSGASEG